MLRISNEQWERIRKPLSGGAFPRRSSGPQAEALTDLAKRCAREAPSTSGVLHRCHVRPAKGGREQIGPRKRRKGVKIMEIVERYGLPPAVTIHAAKSPRGTQVQLTFDFYMIEARPDKPIGDRACGSGQLDEQLRAQGNGADRATSRQSKVQARRTNTHVPSTVHARVNTGRAGSIPPHLHLAPLSVDALRDLAGRLGTYPRAWLKKGEDHSAGRND